MRAGGSAPTVTLQGVRNKSEVKKLVVIWLAVAAALVIVRAAHAPPKIRVSFSVTCEDSSSTSKLTGHISNALRSISDVEVVEMDPLFDMPYICPSAVGVKYLVKPVTLNRSRAVERRLRAG
jgi:hypothetical protein